MKTITVTIKRETQVQVEIDDNVVDFETLKAIQQTFDESMFDLDYNTVQRVCEDEFTEEEIGYMNYAKCAAMHSIGLECDFITLEQSHTKAMKQEDDFEFDINIED